VLLRCPWRCIYNLNRYKTQGLKLYDVHRLLICANDNNLLENNIQTTKTNTEVIIYASKEVDLEVNTEKIKYMLLSRHQNAGQNRDTRIANRRFENVAQFKYLGTTVKNKNLVQKKIRRLNSGNACYHSVQNLLSINVKIVVYNILISRVIL
jgi:hypothetical protein